MGDNLMNIHKSTNSKSRDNIFNPANFKQCRGFVKPHMARLIINLQELLIELEIEELCFICGWQLCFLKEVTPASRSYLYK